MAQRRMFSLKITNSDPFTEMPLSTQALYFHLAMNADDDGFVDGVKRIQRSIGASDDDLKLLIAKCFIIPFDSGIVVIRQWRIHNYIQKDRYVPTIHTEEYRQLSVVETGEKGSYVRVYEQLKIPVNTGVITDVSKMDTECIQNVSTGKVRVRDRDRDRVRLGQSKVSPYEDDDEDEEDPEGARVCARVREETKRAWNYYFGKEPTPATLDRIARIFVGYEIDPELVRTAVMITAQREPASPADYLVSVLADWIKNRVKTQADLDEYLFLFDASSGKLERDGLMFASHGQEALRKFREDRETDEERQARLAWEARREEERQERVARIQANKAKREAEEQAAAAAKAASADY